MNQRHLPEEKRLTPAQRRELAFRVWLLRGYRPRTRGIRKAIATLTDPDLNKQEFDNEEKFTISRFRFGPMELGD